MPRIIDCINDFDSFWAHNGKTVFNLENELPSFQMCLAAVERGFNDEDLDDEL